MASSTATWPARQDHPPAGERAEPPEGGRDELLDNARLLLIVFVVTAHVIRLNLYDVGWARALYAWLFVFMMPAFAAIAGHLSSPAHSVRNVVVLARRILAPYLVFEVLYSIAEAAGPRADELTIDLLTPTWVLWFLVTLFLWRLFLPLLVKTGRPLLLATVIGLAGGLLPSPVYTLALTRALVLLPFFVAGYVVSRDRITGMKACPLANAAVLAGAAVFAALFLRGGGQSWLHGTQPYTNMGFSPLAGVPVRLAYYVGVGLVVASFLALVPARRFALTHLGGRTLHPYLLHGVVLLSLEPLVDVGYSPGAAAALLAAGVLLALGLATRPVARATRLLVDPVSGIAGLARRRGVNRR